MESNLVVEGGTFRKLVLFADEPTGRDGHALSFSAITSSGGAENICKIDVMPKSKVAEPSRLQSRHKVYGCVGLLRVNKGIGRRVHCVMINP